VSAQSAPFIALALALALEPLVSHAAPDAPDAAALAHCAAISGADARLACYDSIARPKPSPAPAASSAAPSAKATAPAAPGGAAAVAPAAAANAPGSAAGTAGGAHTDTTSFGLTKHAAPADPGPDHIQAKVTRVDMSRLGYVRLSLDNGQAWTFTATDTLLRAGDAVTIRRGVLGSFLLTTPAHHTYKAERLQ
jgi:hypothetical protein